ncbi:MAG: hypothetical protein QNK18_12945 [Gammaproteobacteria bacterium]|nr:hypothetical protein [Gammaproteobacteria bacterium]
MSVTINYSTNVEVNGTLALSSARAVRAEAYDEVNITVPPMSNGEPGTLQGVAVQPGDLEQIQFLLITSSVLDPLLTYTVVGGSSAVALDSVQIFSGEGILGLLGSNPNQLSFSNGTIQEAEVRILVGRRASTGSAESGGGGP